MTGRDGRPRIVICFFGITRSLAYTAGGLETHVLTPARRLGDTIVLGHFYRQTTIDNPRTRERGTLREDEHRLLAFDRVTLEAPDVPKIVDFEELRRHGDYWGDGFASLRNLVAQLHSLNEVTAQALSHDPDLVVFCRPDLWFHDSLESELRTMVRRNAPSIVVPYWQPWGGRNDRFAIVRGAGAIACTGMRGLRALEYCDVHAAPLHAEGLLRWATQHLTTRTTGVRASRVRFRGDVQFEDFTHPWEHELRRRLPFVGGRHIAAAISRAIHGRPRRGIVLPPGGRLPLEG